MRTALCLLLSVGLTIGLTGCGSDGGDSSTPETAPKTNAEARSGPDFSKNPVPAPDVAMTTLDGETIQLAEQSGKVVLVNFWATWCAPCRKEIPDLINLYSDLQSDGLLVVGVATDDEGESVVAPFVKKHDVNYPIVVDTSRTIESKFDAMYGLPTTYVVNPEGQIIRRILGIFPTDEMRPKLEAMLQKGASDEAT
jgi:peroxiredoxin